MDKKTIVWKLICGIVIVAAAVLLLSGVLNNHDVRYHTQALTRESLTKLSAKAPDALAYDGTINAAAWKDVFPYIASSMDDNGKNDEIVDYLAQDPYLVK